MITPIKQDQFHAANKAVIDTLLSVANTAFAAAENLAALNLAATRSNLEAGGRHAKASLAARTPQELVAMNSAQVQPNLSKAVAYSQDIYQINATAAQKLFQLVQAQFYEMNNGAQNLATQFASAQPFSSEVALAAIKQAVTASNTTFNNLKKVAEQTAAVAEKSVKGTAEAALKATEHAIKATAKAAPASTKPTAAKPAPAKKAAAKKAAPKKAAPAKAPLLTPVAKSKKK